MNGFKKGNRTGAAYGFVLGFLAGTMAFFWYMINYIIRSR